MKDTFQLTLQDKKIEVVLDGFADQASGSCLVKQGDTVILNTAQLGEEKPEMGFFPLSCEYEEKFYATGKILGSRFMRREGRPSTNAVLISRMIDRAVRPLFPEGLKKEVQCIATCFSYEEENDPALLGLNGISLALGLSEIPFFGPVSAVRVGRVNNELILYPSYTQREEGDLDIIFAGTEKDGKVLINMIEAKCNEVSEDTILESFDFAEKFLKQLLDFQKDIISKHGKSKIEEAKVNIDVTLEKTIKDFLNKNLEKVFYQKDRNKAKKDTKDLEKELIEIIKNDFDESSIDVAKTIFHQEKERVLSENILQRDKRPDGRPMTEIRKLDCSVGILPRTHGSAIFARGETRILSALTLGPPGDQQLLEDMEFSGKKRFLHHYNFPPYSVGEVKRIGSPGRREIGHGMLAEKALLPLLPSMDVFPYTIRIVSEALSSNGSTSMASVCAGCLSLMDAGVPIKRPVAGIAIGLIKKDEDNYKLLTDIQGPEDGSGDMDFKVAGTKEGINVIQMDVKIDGISRKIIKEALERAKKARFEIIDTITKTLKEPRKELSVYAPKIYTININPSKIGLVIGSGGKTINDIIETCGVSVDIEDSGEVFISSDDSEKAKKAIDWIKNLTKDFEVGELLEGKIVKITDFGCFVELGPNQDGLVHISELAPFRVDRVDSVVKVGDRIPVKIINKDAQGKLSLSAKAAGFAPKQPFLKKQGGLRQYGRKGK